MEVVINPTTSKRKLEDHELIQRAVKGDQKAYASLMEKYRHSIYQTVSKMVSNKEDATDLTLEAFGKAFKNLAAYSPTYAFSTWLFRIAVNNCIDHIRKQRATFLSIDEPVEPEGEHLFSANLRSISLNPEENIIREQRLELTRHIISQLDHKYRLMIELRYFEELSYEEISQELNIPLGTVKAQLFRAKEMLYEQLQRPGASAYFESTRKKKK